MVRFVGCETSTEQAPNLVKAALGFLSFTQIEKIFLNMISGLGPRSLGKFGQSGSENLRIKGLSISQDCLFFSGSYNNVRY